MKIAKATETGFYVSDEATGFDPSVDYNEVLAQYNRLADEKKATEAHALLRRYGGIINLIGLIEEQKKQKTTEV
jgi:hypothetical protein